jgi:hypothetical protein
LAPGEVQTLRVRVRSVPQAPTVALVATFEPLEAEPGPRAGVVARLRMVTVIVGKVRVE